MYVRRPKAGQRQIILLKKTNILLIPKVGLIFNVTPIPSPHHHNIMHCAFFFAFVYFLFWCGGCWASCCLFYVEVIINKQ